MALPLPRVISDVGPGGPIVTGMRGINALTKENIENQYLPMTKQSEAASKLAYANLMGPQFLAKLMGNKDILANLNNPQEALNLLYQAGSGKGTGNALLNPNAAPQASQSLSPLEYMINHVRNAFGLSKAPSSAQPTNALNQQMPNLSQQDQQGINSLQPGQSYQIEGNPNVERNPFMSPNQKFAENKGTYEGIAEEGKEAGKIRAKDVEKLNDIVFNADTKLATLNDLNNIISSPEMREIRQLPLAGSRELSYYAKLGTPAQQQLIGRIRSQLGNVIKDSARDFAGQFRKGEQQLLTGMKANDSDTIDSMIGKQESLTTMAQLLRDRSALTSKYMTKYHVNKLEAQDRADAQLNGDETRKKIHEKLNPTVTITNKKTGERLTVPVSEARTKYGIKNV